jgi:hypothetical protein
MLSRILGFDCYRSYNILGVSNRYRKPENPKIGSRAMDGDQGALSWFSLAAISASQQGPASWIPTPVSFQVRSEPLVETWGRELYHPLMSELVVD